ncbi:hypothetical protein LXL04_001793 [Taraxacum kok-saghyz]
MPSPTVNVRGGVAASLQPLIPSGLIEFKKELERKHTYQLSTPVHLEPPPTTVPPPPVSPEKHKCSPIVPKLLPQLLHTATTPPHTFLSEKHRRKHPKSAVVTVGRGTAVALKSIESGHLRWI